MIEARTRLHATSHMRHQDMRPEHLSGADEMLTLAVSASCAPAQLAPDRARWM